MRVLVTGGAGFIGSHLVESRLALGDEVTVLDDFNDFYSPEIKNRNLAEVLTDIRVVRGDIRDTGLVERVFEEGRFDVVVHLAARAGVRPSLKDPRLYVDTNIVGTLNVLEAARRTGVGRVVNASSSSVYGVLRTAPFREDMALTRTISPYAATKLAGEQLCSNYSHLYGIRTVSLRFFTVYGPRQRPDLAIHGFSRRIWEGRPIQQFGDGSTRRDYTYIDDIIQGVNGAISYEGEACDVFNLGESQTTTLTELIGLIEKALGKKAVVEVLPEQPGDVPLTYADISKARQSLGYRPSVCVERGIPRFAEWFLSVAGEVKA
jgi:UDP-glucuronate 4-epimerase